MVRTSLEVMASYKKKNSHTVCALSEIFKNLFTLHGGHHFQGTVLEIEVVIFKENQQLNCKECAN